MLFLQKAPRIFIGAAAGLLAPDPRTGTAWPLDGFADKSKNPVGACVPGRSHVLADSGRPPLPQIATAFAVPHIGFWGGVPESVP